MNSQGATLLASTPVHTSAATAGLLRPSQYQEWRDLPTNTTSTSYQKSQDDGCLLKTTKHARSSSRGRSKSRPTEEASSSTKKTVSPARSKSRSRTTTRVVQKTSTVPANINTALIIKVQRAAITIQRMMRGWFTKNFTYRIKYLQYQLDHKARLDREAVQQVRDQLKRQKQYERQKWQRHYAALPPSAEYQAAEAQIAQSKQIIEQLRTENKRLRDKNSKIAAAILELKHQNDRLENCNDYMQAGSLETLQRKLAQMQATHDKLREVEPKYRRSVEQLKQAVAQQGHECAVQHRIKLRYLQVMGQTVDVLEARGVQRKQPVLVDKVVGVVLKINDLYDHALPLPDLSQDDNELVVDDKKETLKKKTNRMPSLYNNHHAPLYTIESDSDESDSDDEDDSENYDEYSVVTWDN